VWLEVGETKLNRPHQEPLLRECALIRRAPADRLTEQLGTAVPEADRAVVPEAIGVELRGLHHGLLVIFDGGSA
jgi:hypothetical protein